MSAGRSLMISPIMPSLGGNGLALRMGVFADALAEIADVHVLVVPVAGKLQGKVPVSDRFTLHHLEAGGGQVETRFALLTQLSDPAARLRAFADWGRPSQTAGLSRPLLNGVGSLVRELAPKHVHVGRLGLAPCISMLPEGIPVTLDLDEDDRAAFALNRVTSPDRAAWLRQEGLACDRLIAEHGARAARIYVASDAEKTSLARRHPGLDFTVVENAVPPFLSRPAPGGKRIAVFVGSLSYQPNTEGLTWFIRRVLPHLAGSGFRLEVTGAGAPPSFVALARRSGVALNGWAPETGPVYRNAAMAILPLLSGGGTRIKLLEAAASGVPIVATRRAAVGLRMPPESGLFADDPREFAECIRETLRDAAAAGRRASRARAYVLRKFGRDRIINGLAQDLKTVF